VDGYTQCHRDQSSIVNSPTASTIFSYLRIKSLKRRIHLKRIMNFTKPEFKFYTDTFDLATYIHPGSTSLSSNYFSSTLKTPPFESLIFLEYIYGRDHLKKKTVFTDGSKFVTAARGLITNGLVKQTTK
jgi:hypothetical protein